MAGVPSRCALLDGFAIGARVSLLSCYDDIAPNAKCQQVLVIVLCLVYQVSVCGCKRATVHAVYYMGMLYLHNDIFFTDIIVYDRLKIS